MKTNSISFSSITGTVKTLAAALVLFGGVATFSGCATKGCTDLFSDNYDSAATEDDGTCIPSRDKFVGLYTYSGTVTCGGGTPGTITNDPLTVTKATSAANKLIFNFDGLILNCTANGAGAFTIDEQTKSQSGETFKYTGSGSLSGTNLTVTVTEVNQTNPETCVINLTGTKQ